MTRYNYMTTLYCNKSTGKLYRIDERLGTKFSTSLIKIGDAVTIEYKRIKITSDQFDTFGTTDVMITTSVKSIQTKEKTMESITYYDKNVKPTPSPIKSSNSIWSKKDYVITTFDPTEYGNSVCYYNPGYSGNTINIATKFWNINDSNYILNIMSYIKDFISLTKILPTPIAPYISLVDGIIDNTSAILVNVNDNELLEETHLSSFSNSYEYEPFLVGFYVCLPTVRNLNEINNIIKKYCIRNNTLVRREEELNTDDATTIATFEEQEYEAVVEYTSSYFILEVSNKPRPELVDFDFAASSNDLLSNLYKNEPGSVNNFVKLSTESNDLNIIKQIHDLVSASNGLNNPMFTSLFNHLSEDSKLLVKKLYPNL